MRRRDFIRSGGLFDDDLRSRTGDMETQFAQSQSGALIRLRRQAMACMFELQIPALLAGRRDVAKAFELIDAIEQQLTVYRDDSEVSRLNQRAATEPVRVEPLLFGLLERCRRYWDETEGAFDITSGPLIRTWGFLRRQGRVPTDDEIAECAACVGMHLIELNRRNRSIRFSKPGMELNFGAIGKGYALDRSARFLRGCGIEAALMSGGHSSVVAIGKPQWDDGWRVDVADPLNLDRTIATLVLKDQAIATSGLASQSFVVGGERYGHILDPRTGRPAKNALQVTACAPSASRAEALSTAFFVKGFDWTAEHCRRHQELGVLYISEPVSKTGAAVRTLGAIALAK